MSAHRKVISIALLCVLSIPAATGFVVSFFWGFWLWGWHEGYKRTCRVMAWLRDEGKDE